MNRFASLVLLCIVALVGSSSEAQAQTLTVSEDILTEGTSTDLTFTDASRAGQTVKITATSPGGTTQIIKIVLDANGKGTTSWEVPNWSNVVFNNPFMGEVNRLIQPPSQPVAALQSPSRGLDAAMTLSRAATRIGRASSRKAAAFRGAA